ncbi:Phosphatidylinositol transfer protein beta [Paragonimus heterotremus]|uniref:Phosphatidylinositol transfer protein beta n=1 Tax=Paragonimus heterotremus TaxID=100268 RepID=A0A8J4SSD3_9TREM|nr:Phosphatidylinositol transfer protein beta [Paragonimus heterotremus]
MLIKEFRIILPMTVEEYRVAQLYAVAEASKGETGGGDGVEILVNEPFTTEVYPPDPPLLDGDPRYQTGQYTHKLYHLAHKVPGIVRQIAPTKSLILQEVAWNAYPYCRTVLTVCSVVVDYYLPIIFQNDYFTTAFCIKIESLHSSDINLTNAHQLSPEELENRKLVNIDIGDISPSDKDYNPDEDPTTFKSQKTGRGPLKPEWWLDGYSGPIMCAYKLVRCLCKIPLLQQRLESMILRQEYRLFANFHRQVFCWMDRWYGMTLEDIRRLEEETKRELEVQRLHGSARGHVGTE